MTNWREVEDSSGGCDGDLKGVVYFFGMSLIHPLLTTTARITTTPNIFDQSTLFILSTTYIYYKFTYR